jgi:hypothetical protein
VRQAQAQYFCHVDELRERSAEGGDRDDFRVVPALVEKG